MCKCTRKIFVHAEQCKQWSKFCLPSSNFIEFQKQSTRITPETFYYAVFMQKAEMFRKYEKYDYIFQYWAYVFGNKGIETRTVSLQRLCLVWRDGKSIIFKSLSIFWKSYHENDLNQRMILTNFCCSRYCYKKIYLRNNLYKNVFIIKTILQLWNTIY